jgi:hypothetical protein
MIEMSYSRAGAPYVQGRAILHELLARGLAKPSKDGVSVPCIRTSAASTCSYSPNSRARPVYATDSIFIP